MKLFCVVPYKFFCLGNNLELRSHGFNNSLHLPNSI